MSSVVFDLDGTLIDSAPDLQEAANKTLEDSGREPLSLVEARSFIGNGAAVFVDRICSSRSIPDIEKASFLEAFLVAYQSAVNLTEVYTGARESLEKLKLIGYSISLCTNKPMAPCVAILDHLKLVGLFDVIIAGDTLNTRKPSPEPLRLAFEQLGHTTAVYVGDSEIDGETALRAEVPFLLYTEGYRKVPVQNIPHRASFSRFDDLAELVQSHLPLKQNNH